jgi:transposase
MVKRRELSIDLREKIVQLHRDDGLGYKAIAGKLEIPVSTVESIVQKFKNTGSIKDRPRSGRPRKLSEKSVKYLANVVRRQPHLHSKELVSTLQSQGIAEVGARTVRHVLQQNGLLGRVARKKPFLRLSHKKQRLEFARRLAGASSSYFHRVVWSDETKVNLFDSDGRHYIRRRVGEDLLDKHLVPTVKHGGGSLMLWGCMSAAGVGELVFIPDTLNAVKYQEILEEKMVPSARRLVGPNYLFQSDNDPKHTAKSTLAYLKRKGIKVLGPWPSQSPDLNPIENCWRILKEAVRRRTPRNLEELKAVCSEEWNKILPEYCTKLVNSMPKRLNAVIARKGGHIKY